MTRSPKTRGPGLAERMAEKKLSEVLKFCLVRLVMDARVAKTFLSFLLFLWCIR